jgi:hypothetical protein
MQGEEEKARGASLALRLTATSGSRSACGGGVCGTSLSTSASFDCAFTDSSSSARSFLASSSFFFSPSSASTRSDSALFADSSSASRGLGAACARFGGAAQHAIPTPRTAAPSPRVVAFSVECVSPAKPGKSWELDINVRMCFVLISYWFGIFSGSPTNVMLLLVFLLGAAAW